MVTQYQNAINFVTPILHSAVQYQEDTVATAEAMGTTGAAEARAQWEAKKANANLQIAALEAFGSNLTPDTTTTDTTPTPSPTPFVSQLFTP